MTKRKIKPEVPAIAYKREMEELDRLFKVWRDGVVKDALMALRSAMPFVLCHETQGNQVRRAIERIESLYPQEMRCYELCRKCNCEKQY